MAPLHSGFLLEYPLVRVDNFTSVLPELPRTISDTARKDLPEGATHFSSPHISLLSHCHTDHLNGLASISKPGTLIFCSRVTKELILSLERKQDRERYDNGQAIRIRPYSHLRRSWRKKRLNHPAVQQQSSQWDFLVSNLIEIPYKPNE